MLRFVFHFGLRHLLVTPKDRKVVIVESIFVPTLWKQTLARVLYLHYEVLHVLWVPAQLASVCMTGTDTALVVEFGATEISVIPVFKGVTLVSHILIHELGADAFDK